MKLVRIITITLALASALGVSEALAQDLLDLEKRRGDITVMHDRTVLGFDEIKRLVQEDPEKLPIFLVTTKSKGPTATEYDTAMAYAKALNELVPQVSFTTGEELKNAATYYVVVEEKHGHDVSEKEATVYGSRTTAVQCTSNYSLECRETGTDLTPIGTKKVTLIDRYVDVYFYFYKRTYYGLNNMKLEADGSKTLDETEMLARDSITIAYDAGECRDEAAAASTIASIIAAKIFQDRPRKVRFQTTPGELNCDER